MISFAARDAFDAESSLAPQSDPYRVKNWRFWSLPPLRCVQPAGSALFVPSGWKHATINLAPSVGVAVEVGDVDVIERAQRAAPAAVGA